MGYIKCLALSSFQRKRNPAANQTQPTKRRHGTQEPEARRVQHEQVQAPAEESHAGGKQDAGDGVLDLGGDEQGDRVHELVVRGGGPVGDFGRVRD